MKKLTVIVALMAVAFAANAQSINVQSAIQDLKRGYLNKAKDAIDLACKHESTKGDAKTWCYKGLIYSQIGGEATNPKSKFKNLAPNWCEEAMQAALECKRLDKDNEFADQNNSVFRFVGQEYYERAVKAYNDQQDYAASVNFCEKAIQVFNESGDKKFADDAYYLAGLASKVLKNKDDIMKYFKVLVRRKSDKKEVYTTLFELYKADSNNDEAMKVANNYYKNCPNDFNAALLLAQGYLVNGNLEKGKEMLNTALDKTKDNPQVYSELLCAVASILENTKDYEGAEARYNESLQISPSQFAANFGMGKMIYNRGVDKLDAANNVDPDDETGLYDKLLTEANDFFRQSIQYFNTAIGAYDAMNEGQAKGMLLPSFNLCLNALQSVYARLDMFEELKPIKARIAEIQGQH